MRVSLKPFFAGGWHENAFRSAAAAHRKIALGFKSITRQDRHGGKKRDVECLGNDMMRMIVHADSFITHPLSALSTVALQNERMNLVISAWLI